MCDQIIHPDQLPVLTVIRMWLCHEGHSMWPHGFCLVDMDHLGSDQAASTAVTVKWFTRGWAGSCKQRHDSVELWTVSLGPLPLRNVMIARKFLWYSPRSPNYTISIHDLFSDYSIRQTKPTPPKQPQKVQIMFLMQQMGALC
jgi:hypothetical protein